MSILQRVKDIFEPKDDNQKEVLEAYKIFCFLSFFIPCIVSYVIAAVPVMFFGFLILAFSNAHKNKVSYDLKTHSVICDKTSKSFPVEEESETSTVFKWIGLFILVQVPTMFVLSIYYHIPLTLFWILSFVFFSIYLKSSNFAIEGSLGQFNNRSQDQHLYQNDTLEKVAHSFQEDYERRQKIFSPLYCNSVMNVHYRPYE